MAYTQEENNDLIAETNSNTFQPSGNNLEDLLDLVAISLIESDLVNTTHVENNQKFIRDGLLQVGQNGGGTLALFQKDIKANEEDLNSMGGESGEVLKAIADSIIDFDTLLVSINEGTDFGISIELSGGGINGSINITEFLVQDGTFSNVSQFIPLSQQQSIVDINKAEEFLDTNIFELLPTGDTRQARIIRFFQELNALLPPNLPQFDLDGDNRVDRAAGGNWTGSLQYSKDNSISYAQDNPNLSNIHEEDAFIHRLKSTANDTNSNRTIQDIYNRILPYLTDILEDSVELIDDRPEYVNQSSGYLQFRNPNQGIIIRNTNQDYIEGLDPTHRMSLWDNTLTYLDTLNNSGVYKAGTGFTITMWVKFLDRVSEGTLFNFGNPLRGVNAEGDSVDEDAFGFKLETFVINKDDQFPTNSFSTFGDCADALTNYNTDLFDNSNTARFVRLVVNDNGQLRDSHLGCNNNFEKLDDSIAVLGSPDGRVDRLLTTTHIPEDFTEWYFICASFNPAVDEDNSHDSQLGNNTLQQTPDFWLNHIELDGTTYTTNSGYGNRCKVEIISKTDLLRARGFKVD